MTQNKLRVRTRTIRALKGYAELQIYPIDDKERVCFSLHGPRGGFAGNFWFNGQDLVDMLAELGFTAGKTATPRSLALEIVMMEIGRVERWGEPRSRMDWLLLLIQRVGLVAQAMIRDNRITVMHELSKVAALAIGMIQIEDP
jgi:hypothetical protein